MKQGCIFTILLLVLLFLPSLIPLSAVEPSTESLAVPSVTGGPSFPNGRSVSVVVDGDEKAYWAGDPASQQWALTFDFGKVVMLPSLRVSYFSGRYQAKETKVLLSDDGQNWDEFALLPIGDSPELPVRRLTRFVKLEMKGRLHDKQPAITEVTFGERVKNKAAGAAHSSEKPAGYSQGKAAASGWPAAVQKVRYMSSVDNSLQSTLFYRPLGDKAVPLLVALHTWSSDYLQPEPAYAEWCIAKGWAFVHPNFRGANNKPEACGSELVVKDILSAVEYAKQNANIDPDRIYLVGVSGGGYAAMLMAGRAPQLWAGVSAWCGIFDLREWYKQTLARKLGYPEMLARSCGGIPGANAEVDAQFRTRSANSTFSEAKAVPMDLNTGIHDGHTGSVPTSQTLEAYNSLAAPEDRIAEADIASITEQAKIPDSLKKEINDPLYARGKALMRKKSGNTRVTVFEGGHAILFEAALAWLEQQRKGKPAVWEVPSISGVNLQSQPIEAGK